MKISRSSLRKGKPRSRRKRRRRKRSAKERKRSSRRSPLLPVSTSKC
jgi:hypothetical protein